MEKLNEDNFIPTERQYPAGSKSNASDCEHDVVLVLQ
jgi:hypothetical protein